MTIANDQVWFVARLREHGVEIQRSANQAIDGVTTMTERRERLRTAILAHGIAGVIVGSNNGKCESYAQAFERLFGEPLVPKPTRGKRNA